MDQGRRAVEEYKYALVRAVGNMTVFGLGGGGGPGTRDAGSRAQIPDLSSRPASRRYAKTLHVTVGDARAVPPRSCLHPISRFQRQARARAR